MRRAPLLLALCAGLTPISGPHAASAIDGLLETYRKQSAAPLDARAGRKLWTRPFTPDNTRQPRSCASCHTPDPRSAGTHARTGKSIAPLAPSVNPERLTDTKKVRKWFRRNCRWTLGRDCTAQEQGDLLLFLKNL